MRATTKMIMAKRALSARLGADAAKWACAMLESGSDTPHLRMVAGTTGHENTFELDELVDRALKELNFSVPSKNTGLVLYAQELAQDYLNSGISRDELLQTICQLCIDTDYFKPLYPFYILRWAWDDLQDEDFSPHRQDVNRANFEDTLRSEIKALLETKYAEPIAPANASEPRR